MGPLGLGTGVNDLEAVRIEKSCTSLKNDGILVAVGVLTKNACRPFP
jgi:hypothetical protein